MAADSLFGVHGAALEVRGQRMGVLASNIANAASRTASPATQNCVTMK